jgi:hypothetical protein
MKILPLVLFMQVSARASVVGSRSTAMIKFERLFFLSLYTGRGHYAS